VWARRGWRHEKPTEERRRGEERRGGKGRRGDLIVAIDAPL